VQLPTARENKPGRVAGAEVALGARRVVVEIDEPGFSLGRLEPERRRGRRTASRTRTEPPGVVAVTPSPVRAGGHALGPSVRVSCIADRPRSAQGITSMARAPPRATNRLVYGVRRRPRSGKHGRAEGCARREPRGVARPPGRAHRADPRVATPVVASRRARAARTIRPRAPRRRPAYPATRSARACRT